MAQVTMCDHCGKPIDESVQPFARVNYNASIGGGGQLDFHNDAENPCFYAFYEATKGVSAYPDRYPDVAVAPQQEQAAPAQSQTTVQ